MILKIRLILAGKNLLKASLRLILKISTRAIEDFPSLGILRPLLSSSKSLVFKKKEQSITLPCPYDLQKFQSNQSSNLKIIEVTSFSETEGARGIGNYLTRLFSDVNGTSLGGVVFISFTNHNVTFIPPKFLDQKSVYYIDTNCANCLELIQFLSKSTKKIIFTSYFHDNINPKWCSVLLDSIPDSAVIVYDLIPKYDLLNFSSISRMRSYFAKYNLLSRSQIFSISVSTKLEIENQNLKVTDVIKYKLVKLETSTVQKDKSILVFGSMNPRKNILRTVIAWDMIQKDFPNHKLTLVGHYSKTAKFLILSMTRLGHNSISFPGEISDVELNKLFQRSSLLVAPSTFEGLGLPLIRAIELGIPMICSDIHSFREIVSNEKSFFNPFSISEISRALKFAILSPDEYITEIESVEIGAVKFSQII